MPFDSSLPDEKCAKCGHSRLVHQEPTGSHKGQCGVCFEDLPKRLSKAWLHAFVPADAETAGEPETHPRSGYRDADEAASMYPEPEAPECAHVKPYCYGLESGPAVRRFYYCPDCKAKWETEGEDPESEAEPPRRPPYAVAYAIEGGAQYEIALPGDATVRAVDGALVITHDKPVLAMGQVRPMEGA